MEYLLATNFNKFSEHYLNTGKVLVSDWNSEKYWIPFEMKGRSEMIAKHSLMAQ